MIHCGQSPHCTDYEGYLGFSCRVFSAFTGHNRFSYSSALLLFITYWIELSIKLVYPISIYASCFGVLQTDVCMYVCIHHEIAFMTRARLLSIRCDLLRSTVSNNVHIQQSNAFLSQKCQCSAYNNYIFSESEIIVWIVFKIRLFHATV